MKKILLAGAAVMALALVASGPAKAAAINAAIDLSSTTQNAGQTVDQGAVAIDLAIGAVNDHSSVSSTALNGVNLDTTNVSESVQTGAGFADGGLSANGLTQATDQAVHQSSLAVEGSGAVNAVNEGSNTVSINVH